MKWSSLSRRREKRWLTIEATSLWTVGVEKAERDDDDEEETGDHHCDYRSHGHWFYFDTREKEKKKE